MPALRSLSAVLLSAWTLHAQEAAALSGAVVDARESPVAAAQVSLTELARGGVREAVTDASGRFVFDGLPAGDYKLEISKPGFKTLRIATLRLVGRDRRTFVLDLQPAAANAEAVSGDSAGISFDPAAATALDRGFAEFLPLAMRAWSSVALLAPGITPIGRDGEPSANGLRPGATYFTVDGVTGPLGSMNEVRSVPFDAIESADIQTSAVAPEFGRSAGAQVALTTRSGTNHFHGSLFEYHKPDAFAANDWFANRAGLTPGQRRENLFGGTLGGPLLAANTYFFGAYEGRRSRLPQTGFAAVPGQAARESAAPGLKPYLDLFPLPNGPQFSSVAGLFSSVRVSRHRSDSGTLRLDHGAGGPLSVFARYQYSPRSEQRRQTDAPNTVTDLDVRGQSFTAALIWLPAPRTTHDLRMNFSTWRMDSGTTAEAPGGPEPGSLLGRSGALAVSVLGAGGYAFNIADWRLQRQLHIADSLSHAGGSHYLRVGVDYRRLAATYRYQPYRALFTFNGFTSASGGLLSGTAAAAAIVSSEPAVYPLYTGFSLYLQDTWRATSRTTLTWGFRWDINPAPDVRSGPPPIAFKGFADFPDITRVDPLYATRWRDFGPRVGLAYQLDTTPGREMMFRFGAGVLYDIGYGFAVRAFDAAPFVNQKTYAAPAFPLPPDRLEPIAVPATRPYGLVSASEPDLHAPRAYLWNASIERMFGGVQSLVLTYAGAKVRDLLWAQTRRSYSEDKDTGSPDYDLVHVLSNKPVLNYQSLQVQFRRRLSPSLQTQLSYTFSHAIDTGAFRLPPPGLAVIFDDTRRDSDFDLRHNFSFSGSWAFPSPRSGIAKGLFGNWWTDWLVTARSSLPLEVLGLATEAVAKAPVRRLYGLARPNLVKGEALWLEDAAAPGGRRLNPAAFALAGGYAHGNLPRNSLRGFDLFQADVAVRRRFLLTEGARLDLFAQAYNVFNHANFMNPTALGTAFLGSPMFGLGTPWHSPALGPAPRSLQFALRVEF